MKNLNLILFAAFALCVACKENPIKKSKPANTYLNTDIVLDSVSPAGMIELQIQSSGSTIYGLEYTANGEGPHPTLVLLHGLPGNERNLDLAQNIRRAGYNVIYFDYRGNWGGEGKFSFANGIADAKAVLDHITDSANIETMRIDTNRIFLMGHNTGGGMALVAGVDDPRVKGIITLSLFNPYRLFRGRSAELNAADLAAYFSTLGTLNTKPEEFLQEITQHIDSYNMEQIIANSNKPILVIDEQKANDYLSQYKSNKKLAYEVWGTDITFTNKRIALSNRVNAFLEKYAK